jgi:hypothetical protein
MTKHVESRGGFRQASINFSVVRQIPCKVAAGVEKLVDRLDVLCSDFDVEGRRRHLLPFGRSMICCFRDANSGSCISSFHCTPFAIKDQIEY